MKETLRIFFACITSHLPFTPSKGYGCQASCSSLPLLLTLVSVQEWFQVYHSNGPITFNFNSTTTPDCRISYYSQLVSFQPFELICKSACLTLPLSSSSLTPAPLPLYCSREISGFPEHIAAVAPTRSQPPTWPSRYYTLLIHHLTPAFIDKSSIPAINLAWF